MVLKNICNYFGLWFLCVVMLSQISCKTTKVEPLGYSQVSFTVDWKGIKDGAPVPDGAVVYLYPKNGGEPVVSKTNQDAIAEFTVPEGFYKIIMHNDNLSAIKMRNYQSCLSFEGYVEPVVAAATGGAAVPEVDYLHLLTGAYSKEIQVIKDIPLNLTLRPRTATNTLRMNVEINSPREYTAVSASLSGIATKIEIFTAKVLTGDISSINIPLNLQTKEGKVTANGRIEVIGIDPANRNAGANVLELFLKPKQPEGGEPIPDEVLSQDLTNDLKEHENMNIEINIVVKPNPDPTQPEKLIMEITIKDWAPEPPIDLDVVPTE